MTASPAVPDPAHGRRGLMYWLPPHGFGNGIDATAWAELTHLTDDELSRVLLALADARIAAYVAQLRHLPFAGDDGPVTYRLWVDSLRYRRAEDVLMEVLRGKRARRPRDPS
ncbi:hypothetical protein [Amycolatopsis nalaikhensis]|uniref:Uncharacterized protein n=1 Tax=Amycolatopsis nalaikhensis TaxID=715472 RepID=A0ABY8XU88_9PSEU|nr:hypothetical protein [Amycolatopsis sp. 2-2]WIV59146.1 hypothetical protein QP939_11205 [Amycolatopsis sp. 2-2]